MCSTIGATTMPWATRSVTTSAVSDPSGRRHLGRAGLAGERVRGRRDRPRVGHVAVADRPAAAARGARAAGPAGRAWRPTGAPSRASGRAPAPCRRRRGAACSPPWSPKSGAVEPSSCGRRTSTRCSPVGSSVDRWTTTASPSGVVASMAAGIVADVLITTRSPASQPRRQVAGRARPGRLARRSTPASARRRGGPSVSSGGSVASSSRRQDERGRGRRSGRWPWRSCRHHLAGAVAAARLGRLDEGEDRRARWPRAAGGPRCPRRGTRPGASGCACRRDRWSAPAARGARRRAPGRAWSSAALVAP